MYCSAASVPTRPRVSCTAYQHAYSQIPYDWISMVQLLQWRSCMPIISLSLHSASHDKDKKMHAHSLNRYEPAFSRVFRFVPLHYFGSCTYSKGLHRYFLRACRIAWEPAYSVVHSPIIPLRRIIGYCYRCCPRLQSIYIDLTDLV